MKRILRSLLAVAKENNCPGNRFFLVHDSKKGHTEPFPMAQVLPASYPG